MKNSLLKFTVIIFLFGFFSKSILSQPQYVARYDGPGHGYDRGRLVALDAAGNVYVTGESEDLINLEGFDFATLKYDHYLQNQSWNPPYGNRYSGAAHGNDYPVAIAIDNNAGYVYVTGTTNEIGLFTDITTIAYSLVDGTIKVGFPLRFNNGLKNRAVSMALDAAGNIYVVGNIPEVQNSTLFHIGVFKYSSFGTLLWTENFQYSQYGDYAQNIAVDGIGNVYITGYTVINPNSPYDLDIITIKYSSNGGTPLWFDRYIGTTGGRDRGYSISVEENVNGKGGVYITGNKIENNQEYIITLKYNYLGGLSWANHYNTFDPSYEAIGKSIKVVRRPNLSQPTVPRYDAFVTGFVVSSTRENKITTLKYNELGNLEWDMIFNNSGIGESISVDDEGSAFIAGAIGDIPNGITDYISIKYTSSGNQEGTITYNGPDNGYDYASDIAIDNYGFNYITGESGPTSNTTDFATILYQTVDWLPIGSSAFNFPSSNHLNGVAALSKDTSFVAGDGGVLIRTTNGGTNWISLPSNTTRNFNKISFVNHTKGIAVGDSGSIFITTNSGINWINKSINSPLRFF